MGTKQDEQQVGSTLRRRIDRLGQRLAHLLEYLQKMRQVMAGIGTLGQEVGQGAALDELHGEVGPAISQGAQFVDGNDERMLRARGLAQGSF